MKQTKPLLITGSPRSGTTWMGKMLGAADELHYVHEPFNPHSGAPELGRLRFPAHFTYLNESNEQSYRADIARVMEGRFDTWHALGKVRRPRQLTALLKSRSAHQERLRLGVATLFKDPIALMSAGWLARNFDLNCVVMIRHPAAFVASINRLEWNSRPYRWALSQPELMREQLGSFADELQGMADGDYDVIDHAAMAWKLHHFMIAKYQTEFTDWHFLKHEDMSADPVERFRALYGELGLEFSASAEATILEHTGAQNPEQASGKEKALHLNSAAAVGSWKSVLTEAETEVVRRRVAGVVEQFYPDSDW